MATGDDFEIPESGAVFTFGRSRFSDNQPSHFFIRNDPVIDISCGDEHTVLICQKGRVFAFGSNESGQLGLGHKGHAVDKPTCVKAVKPWPLRLAACGKAHTLLASSCGRVFACGSNVDGQLGLGDVEDRLSPVQVTLSLPEGCQIKALAAGCQHSALLTDMGELFTWGGNSDGQCGNGAPGDPVLIPTKITLDAPVISIACGYYHTAFTSADRLWTMGEGDSGKLGVTSGESSQSSPQCVVLPDGASKPVQVAAGGSHTLVLTDTGEVYGFGSNFSGQLGAGAAPAVSGPQLVSLQNPVTQVSCGESHSAFLIETGELWTCGDSRHGKLCTEATVSDNLTQPGLVTALLLYRVQGVRCGGCHTIVLAQARSSPILNTLSDIDGEVVGKVSALPPLKTRKLPLNGLPTDLIITESPLEEPAQIEATTPDEDAVVVAEQGEGEGDSLTESCGGGDETSPIGDSHSAPDVQELRASPEGDYLEEVENTTKTETKDRSTDSASDPKAPSRISKLVSALRIRTKPRAKTPKTPDANGGTARDEALIKDGYKVGNQNSSKACVIL